MEELDKEAEEFAVKMFEKLDAIKELLKNIVYCRRKCA